MSFVELIIIVIAGILFIKPEQLPGLLNSLRKGYNIVIKILRQKETQITQSSQLEWLNKKMTDNKKKKK
ncbi:MAG: hypothetical protein P8L77_02305 [Gammaproteobacteria bacterium]|nr:hypothetical protein [Gammaproteobacteria bacterium]